MVRDIQTSLSLGECYRATDGNKDGCQAGKDDWKAGREVIEDHQTETRTESQQIQTSMVEHNLKPVQITNYFVFTGKMSNY